MAAYTFAFAAIGLIALLGQTSGLPCATCPGGQWTAPPAYQPHVPAPVQQQWQPQNPGLLQGLLGGPLLRGNNILNNLGSNDSKLPPAPQGERGLVSENNIGNGILSNRQHY